VRERIKKKLQDRGVKPPDWILREDKNCSVK
jgi:hypothetical protein